MINNLLDDGYEIECDNCSEDLHGLPDDFMGAVNAAKAEGWIFQYRNGEYNHFCCRECLKEF